METGWADASTIERVLFVSAVTRPSVFFAGRPAAERAADARTGGVEVFLLVGFAIQHNGRFGNVIQESRSPGSGSVRNVRAVGNYPITRT